jgi:N-acetylmuramic acid 6-phosphate etherase
MPRPIDYDHLPTEQASSELRRLDTLDEQQLVDLIHQQDRLALDAVKRARADIARIAGAVVRALSQKGRLIYVGAGTSGRLAALDAAECPPTFGIPQSQVVAVMAGGSRALRVAVEGAEDSRLQGRESMRKLKVNDRDLVCGISASGVTEFVIAALDESRRRRASTALITCAPKQLVQASADLLICLDVGAETVAGSTRMKAGLATKAVLHSITTSAMIRLGKVYDNMMVEMTPTSRKLRQRAVRIVARLTGLPAQDAGKLLVRAGDSPKVAAVMFHHKLSRQQALRLLRDNNDQLRPIIGDVDDEH